MDQIGIGFIGAGDVADIHKAGLTKISTARLVAVYDRDQEKSRKLIAGMDARVCRSVQDLVADPAVDVVYVLTPVSAHFENAKLALEAGKHTFVEKPVSFSVEEIMEMIRLSAAKGRYCIPGHNYIHAPALKATKELIVSGQLGEIFSLWIFFMLFLPLDICSRIPGVLREVMVHHFYSVLYLLGKPQTLYATNSDPRGLGPQKEDQTLVVCKMPGNAIVTLFGSFSADDLTYDPWTVKYKAIGSRGSSSHTWSMSRLSEKPQPIWDLPGYWESFREEDRFFIEECILDGKEPLSTMDDALTCLKMLMVAERSIETGTAQRFVDSPTF